MKKKVIYIADDGVEFYNEDECKLYEKYAIKEIKEKISALLGNIEPNYFFQILNYTSQCRRFVVYYRHYL